MKEAPAGPDAAWLASQRWFRAKHRRIVEVSRIDGVDLGPGQLTVLELRYADGGETDRYLVPIVDGREPADGEGLWAALATAIDAERRIGSFVSSRTASAGYVPTAERRLMVEQSNTSVVLDGRLILKAYRLLEPGDNPDVEVSEFLARSGFSDTPALYGWMRWEPDDGPAAAAAMVQAFVPSTGDGWAAMLAALAAEPERAIELAASIGELTGRLHAALASGPEDPAFPVRPASAAETAEWRVSAERQLAMAISATADAERERLVDLSSTIGARFADGFGPTRLETRVTRIHGDYHLGQLLARHDGGFSVIDFEGEPARPLAERRVPSSPLRDVAGLMRSLDYAARTAARDGSLDADGWLVGARDAFVAGYGRVGSGELELLAAFELEKALYEVRYEASNRPGWLWLPMAAVERLAVRH